MLRNRNKDGGGKTPQVARDPFDVSEPDLADLPDAPTVKDVVAGIRKKLKGENSYE